MAPRLRIDAHPDATLVHVSGDRIGDALLKLPAILAFRQARPDTRLVWITARRGSVFAGPLAPLVAGVIDELHTVTGLGTRWRETLFPRLRTPFDCVVATEQKLRNTLALKRVPHRTFISPAANFLLSDRKPRPGAYGASVYSQITTLLSLAAGTPLEPVPRIALPSADVALAATLLPAGPRYVGLVPGAGGASKRWPLERFIGVAQYCEAHGHRPVFFLGPDERDQIAELRATLHAALFPEYSAHGAPLGGPLLTIALAARLAVGVANDSGGGHLLAAGGRPLISLFGHTDPEKFRPPYGERIAVRALDFGGPEMTRIPVDVVTAAIARQLATVADAAR